MLQNNPAAVSVCSLEHWSTGALEHWSYGRGLGLSGNQCMVLQRRKKKVENLEISGPSGIWERGRGLGGNARMKEGRRQSFRTHSALQCLFAAAFCWPDRSGWRHQ